MKNATRGLIAGGLGVALLAGGATFALWSDNADVDGGVITAGNLQIATSGDLLWQDVSEDVDGNPSTIAIADFRTVPGDSLQMTQDVAITLEGDNIAATLDVNIPDATGTADFLADEFGLSGTYQLLDGDDAAVGTVGTLGGDAIELTDLDAEDTGTYTLQLDVAFDSATDDQERVNALASLELGDIAFALTQVRP